MEPVTIEITADTSNAVAELKNLQRVAKDTSNALSSIQIAKWKFVACGLAGAIVGYTIGVW